jgi:hypothetical protein
MDKDEDSDAETKTKGGRKGWTSEKQLLWLKTLVPAFLTAQASGKRQLADFWNGSFEEWFIRFPEPGFTYLEAENEADTPSVAPEQQKKFSEAIESRKAVSACYPELGACP